MHSVVSFTGPFLAKYHGRAFKVSGGAALVEFGSAVKAAQCAVELQHGMTVANGDQLERHLVLRIGGILGDVMVEGSELGIALQSPSL